jgi:hypothetical protein
MVSKPWIRIFPCAASGDRIVIRHEPGENVLINAERVLPERVMREDAIVRDAYWDDQFTYEEVRWLHRQLGALKRRMRRDHNGS